MRRCSSGPTAPRSTCSPRTPTWPSPSMCCSPSAWPGSRPSRSRHEGRRRPLRRPPAQGSARARRAPDRRPRARGAVLDPRPARGPGRARSVRRNGRARHRGAEPRGRLVRVRRHRHAPVGSQPAHARNRRRGAPCTGAERAEGGRSIRSRAPRSAIPRCRAAGTGAHGGAAAGAQPVRTGGERERPAPTVGPRAPAQRRTPLWRHLDPHPHRMSPESRICVCPGSYDPITNGHLDIIQRAAELFDEVVVAVVNLSTRKNMPLFGIEERIAFIESATSDLANVRAEPFDILVVDFARKVGAKTIVKGLRAISDFEYEFEMHQLNRMQAPDVDTLYLMASPQYSFLSSSGVKEIATFGGNIGDLVPEGVAERLQEELSRHRTV